MYTLDPDTLLVALYTVIDDLYKALFPDHVHRTGPVEVMSNSEILFLAICAQWLNLPERKFIRFVKTYWHSYVPQLVTQSQYNRRLHALGKVMACLVTAVNTQMKGLFLNSYQVMDTVNVPLMKRCRGKYHKLFPPEIANIGIGGSDHEWYYGIKLALIVNPEGIITGFIFSPASSSDRWLAEYLLCYRNNQSGQPARVENLPLSHKAGYKRVGPTGSIWPKEGVGKLNLAPYLSDRGFNGEWWIEHWKVDYKATVLVPEEYKGDRTPELKHEHYSKRQIIETVNEHLDDELHLKQSEARSVPGLFARIAAKLLALNLGIWLNKLFGRPNLAFATLFSW
jgi:hypothetical protein